MYIGNSICEISAKEIEYVAGGTTDWGELASGTVKRVVNMAHTVYNVAAPIISPVVTPVLNLIEWATGVDKIDSLVTGGAYGGLLIAAYFIPSPLVITGGIIIIAYGCFCRCRHARPLPASNKGN